MCGIAGIMTERRHGIRELDRTIRRMTAALAHRGPDDEGYLVDGKVALGHRRLSIIDLKTGRQPIFNEDRTRCIIFNGEIYNYLEIRKKLHLKGHRFTTASDTETILHAYEEWGEECLSRLNGMFAFCIWDRITGTLFVARDRLGEKPLFLRTEPGLFAFASEMKALLTDPSCSRAIDEEALAAFFTFSYIPAPLTIFRSIRKLEPGHCVTVEHGHVSIRRYWEARFEPDRSRTEQQHIDGFLTLLTGSVRARLMSEVPLGAFLSGGIDSSTVVALMSGGAQGPVNTFTIGFGGDHGGFEDERRYARLVAEQYQANHHEHEVQPELAGTLTAIVKAFDEPFADDGAVPSFFVCREARQRVTVALSGLGGDELFGGYERYLGFQLGRIYSKVPAWFRDGLVRRFIEALPEPSSGSYRVNHLKRFVRGIAPDEARQYLSFVTKINTRYRRSLFTRAGRVYGAAFDATEQRFINRFNTAPAEHPLDRVFACDLATYLPEDILACTDRLSMCHSLEVRVPFLDHELVEYCATIPPELKMKWFRKKYLLKRGVRKLLPREVLEHRKQGFVGPLARWLRTDLRDLTRETLSVRRLDRHGLFDPVVVAQLLDDHDAGREVNDTTIWALLIFQTWFEEYMK